MSAILPAASRGSISSKDLHGHRRQRRPHADRHDANVRQRRRRRFTLTGAGRRTRGPRLRQFAQSDDTLARRSAARNVRPASRRSIGATVASTTTGCSIDDVINDREPSGSPGVTTTALFTHCAAHLRRRRRLHGHRSRGRRQHVGRFCQRHAGRRFRRPDVHDHGEERACPR